MSSKGEICNLAIGHLAISRQISNIDTEKSEEARACRQFYPTVVAATLRDAPWKFTTLFYDLELVEENPTEKWAFAYRYPSSCARFRRIESDVRNETLKDRVPFKIVRDSSGAGKLIYTDRENAVAEISSEITNPELFDPDFVLAVSFRLAALIAPRVTGGDPNKLGERAMKYYIYEISKAEATDGNEQQDEDAPDSEFINARN